VSTSIKGFVLRGLAAGAAGGAATALFLRFVTETQIDFALRFEDATSIGAGPGEAAEFSRGTQHWGGMAAAVLYGAVLGVVLGVTVAALHHRIAARNEFGRAIKVAGGAFVAIVLIPSLKYPPSPPTVGDPDTVSQRTTDYLLLMAASVVVVFAAFFLWQALTERGLDGAPRFALGGGALVLMVTALMVLWPASPDPINPPDSDAKPALTISPAASPQVLARILANAKETGDGWIRDPQDPSEPLDLSTVNDPSDLVGKPAAVSTAKLVPHAYTTVVWHFRMLVLAGLALMWAVMATVFGLLADAPARAEAKARHQTGTTGPVPTS
jgi:hypothetical protein